jgi:hypothetical protein
MKKAEFRRQESEFRRQERESRRQNEGPEEEKRVCILTPDFCLLNSSDAMCSLSSVDMVLEVLRLHVLSVLLSSGKMTNRLRSALTAYPKISSCLNGIRTLLRFSERL